MLGSFDAWTNTKHEWNKNMSDPLKQARDACNAAKELLAPVRWKRSWARSDLDEARKAYDDACDAYGKACDAYDEVYDAYGKTCDEYEKALKDAQKANNKQR
jgi:hypothetical protein